MFPYNRLYYQVMYCWQVEIESQRLLFRRDRCPQADVGVKHDLMHMLLLSYNPVWLKLGLEVRVCMYVCIPSECVCMYVTLEVRVCVRVPSECVCMYVTLEVRVCMCVSPLCVYVCM